MNPPSQTPPPAPAPAPMPEALLRPLRAAMAEAAQSQAQDWPNYHVAEPNTPLGPDTGPAGADTGSVPTADPLRRLLGTDSTVQSFHVGTGLSLYSSVIIPAFHSARRELIFVTCFWAKSDSRDAVRDALDAIARHRIASKSANPGADLPQLRVRICFSTGDASFVKTIFTHPSSEAGWVRDPATWTNPSIGLPPSDLFQAANMDVVVKSIFFWPFSVMHPKFVIVDRSWALIPSCNASFEAWFEGCVRVAGRELITSMLGFFRQVWDPSLPQTLDPTDSDQPGVSDPSATMPPPPPRPDSGPLPGGCDTVVFDPPLSAPALFLPSPHHRNPWIQLTSFFPIGLILQWFASRRTKKSSSSPGALISSATAPFRFKFPPTPLNLTLSTLVDRTARRSVFIQTPNLTSQPVIGSLIGALGRGVDVHVVVSRRLMILEQIVTAFGWTSGWGVDALIKGHRQLLAAYNDTAAADLPLNPSDPAVEAGLANQPAIPVGRLKIDFFKPVDETMTTTTTIPNDEARPEPVKTHLKLTVVDGEYTIFGSGNMDRASWFTSQEIGMLIHSQRLAGAVVETVTAALRGRTDEFYNH